MEENELWQQWEKGMAYQQAMGFHRDFPLFQRYKQGDQWPPATARTRNLPRPVFNIVEMNVRHKRSAVLNGPIALAYTPADTSANRRDAAAAALGADAYTRLAARLWKAAEQDELNARAVDDAATLGTGIWHYFWDWDARGPGQNSPRGDIRGETLDPLCLVLAQPGEADIQRQKYVLIGRRSPLSAVRDLARREGVSPEVLEHLAADDSGPEGTYDREGTDDKHCTLLTRYSRDEKGRVMFSQGTRTAVLVKDRPLTPAGSAGAPVTLYPVVALNWRRRKGSAFGIGEAQELLPNQKAINFNMAMLLLSVQQTAWPKLLSKPGALQQPVTNEPGEHIVDYYTAGGDGIKFMQPPAFSAMAAVLADKVMDLTRRVSDMSEVSTGEPLGGNLAASAILALQNQARTPIEEIQRRYWKAVERIGEIWLQLFGAYYGPVAGDNGALLHPGVFSHYAYDLAVNVGPASEYSRVLAQATLDKMLDRGDVSIDEYIELSDPNIAPFKEQYKRLRQQRTTANTEVPHDLPSL